MVLHEETLSGLGYSVDSLPKGSHKRIIVKCDYCLENYQPEYKNYNGSKKIVDKDACVKCKFKKREDVSLKRDGVKNSAQREDVREKIRNSDWVKSEEFKVMSREASMIAAQSKKNKLVKGL